ncbi:MAG: ATP-binding protein [Pseudomonadota bacterium]
MATGLIAGGLTFRWAFVEAIEMQDAMLLQIGALVAGHHLAAKGPLERGVDPEARIVIAELDRPEASAEARPSLPAFPTNMPEGLQTATAASHTWRVLVRTRSDGSRVGVAQRTETRDEIARGAAMRAVLPLMALIPCLMLLVAVVIRLSFRPVTALAARLDASQSGLPDRLPLDALPDELRPFVTSINRLIERITMLFAQQRRFVADAAHELRSPITALSLQAENLERTALSGDSLQRLEALKTGIRRTAHLLEQLLTLARYEETDRERAPANEAFDVIVKGVVSDLLPTAQARAIDLGFERLEPVAVRADTTALSVLVRNLIDNALRHTPTGGRVDIDLVQQDSAAVLRIEDTGPGIPADDLTRVFEPFVRSGRATDGDGTGLGLSIVRRIADRLGASVTLENIVRPDRSGLRVTVSLPTAAA